MSKYFRPWNIDQTLLLPPNVRTSCRKAMFRGLSLSWCGRALISRRSRAPNRPDRSRVSRALAREPWQKGRFGRLKVGRSTGGSNRRWNRWRPRGHKARVERYRYSVSILLVWIDPVPEERREQDEHSRLGRDRDFARKAVCALDCHRAYARAGIKKLD